MQLMSHRLALNSRKRSSSEVFAAATDAMTFDWAIDLAGAENSCQNYCIADVSFVSLYTCRCAENVGPCGIESHCCVNMYVFWPKDNKKENRR